MDPHSIFLSTPLFFHLKNEHCTYRGFCVRRSQRSHGPQHTRKPRRAAGTPCKAALGTPAAEGSSLPTPTTKQGLRGTRKRCLQVRVGHDPEPGVCERGEAHSTLGTSRSSLLPPTLLSSLLFFPECSVFSPQSRTLGVPWSHLSGKQACGTSTSLGFLLGPPLRTPLGPDQMLHVHGEGLPLRLPSAPPGMGQRKQRLVSLMTGP